MIYKYQKITDEYTTYTLNEPDLNESELKITELCTIDGFTYVNVPDGIILPEQNENIILEEVIMTDELKKQIKESSPHIKLSYKRLRDRIREKYSIDDELYLSRILHGSALGTYILQENEPEKISTYQTWVEECREIARLERVALGL